MLTEAKRVPQIQRSCHAGDKRSENDGATTPSRDRHLAVPNKSVASVGAHSKQRGGRAEKPRIFPGETPGFCNLLVDRKAVCEFTRMYLFRPTRQDKLGQTRQTLERQKSLAYREKCAKTLEKWEFSKRPEVVLSIRWLRGTGMYFSLLQGYLNRQRYSPTGTSSLRSGGAARSSLSSSSMVVMYGLLRCASISVRLFQRS